QFAIEGIVMRGYFIDHVRRRPGVWAFTLIGASLVAITTLWAIPSGPKSGDRQVTRIVSQLMLSQHLSKHKIDDEIGKRGLELYLKSLDPMKVYFMQSDVDEFKKKEAELDDSLRNGDIAFA